jgi:hypothetical protein
MAAVWARLANRSRRLEEAEVFEQIHALFIRLLASAATAPFQLQSLVCSGTLSPVLCELL